MALFKADYSNVVTATELIPASGNQVIRIKRVFLTAWTGLWFQLISDPGGAKESLLTPKLRITAGMIGNFDFTGPFAIGGAAGESLGMTTVYQGAPADYGMMLWYEYVSG